MQRCQKYSGVIKKINDVYLAFIVFIYTNLSCFPSRSKRIHYMLIPNYESALHCRPGLRFPDWISVLINLLSALETWVSHSHFPFSNIMIASFYSVVWYLYSYLYLLSIIRWFGLLYWNHHHDLFCRCYRIELWRNLCVSLIDHMHVILESLMLISIICLFNCYSYFILSMFWWN